MPSADAAKKAFRSKIADIQEHSNFPEAEYALPATDIDLQVRTGFAKHLLVGLNVFFIEIAKQFNAALGIPTVDPMLVKKGVPPLDLTEQSMLDQAAMHFLMVEDVQALVVAGDDMAEESGAIGTGDDPAYKTGGGDTFAYQIPLTAPRARAIFLRWSSGRKPAGSRRLSFRVPQIDRKLVVSSPEGSEVVSSPEGSEGSVWRPHWADGLGGAVTSSWKICTWFCCEMVW